MVQWLLSLSPHIDKSVGWNQLYVDLCGFCGRPGSFHPISRCVSVSLCHRHLAADWLLFIPDVDFIPFSPSLQFQLQNFDIVCSTSWANRDKCCELPSLVRSKSEAVSMFACLKQEEMTWKLLSAHLHTVY